MPKIVVLHSVVYIFFLAKCDHADNFHVCFNRLPLGKA